MYVCTYIDIYKHVYDSSQRIVRSSVIVCVEMLKNVAVNWIFPVRVCLRKYSLKQRIAERC